MNIIPITHVTALKLGIRLKKIPRKRMMIADSSIAISVFAIIFDSVFTSFPFF
jgi:hypothetical protein